MSTSRDGAAPARVPQRGARAGAPTTRPVLATVDVVKEFRSGDTTTRALDGVTLTVPQGRFVTIMGPSGSGKSTLLHLLGGLDSPTSGDVFLRGEPLSALSDRDLTLARRRQIGFVFQFFNLVPVLTVAENVALPRVIDGRKPESYRKRLDAILRLVGLEPEREKLPSEISGGQQQRAAIARALFAKPAVLLADEPTGNLDSRTGAQVLKLMKALQRRLGQTIVMVTHDPRAAAYGDEVVLLQDGAVTATLDLARVRGPNGARGGEVRAEAVLAWLQELGA